MVAPFSRAVKIPWLRSPVTKKTAFVGCLLAIENKECGRNEEGKPCDMIPSQRLPQIANGEDREHDQCDNLLHSLQLCRAELAMAPAIRGNLKTIFEEGDSPRNEDDRKKRCTLELQMSVPSEGHEYIRNHQEEKGFHWDSLPHPLAESISTRRTNSFSVSSFFTRPIMIAPVFLISSPQT